MKGRILAVLAAALAAAAAAAPAPAARKPAFPVTLTAANGQVTLARQPRRIVSLSPTATETLFALGAGKQVVAVDDQSNYPQAAPRTKLSGFKPNAEAVAAYRPDLVVLSNDLNGIVAALAKLRIPTLLQPAARHLNEAFGEMLQLGRATGRKDAAYALVHRLRTQVRRIVGSVPKGGPPLTVYHELDPTYYTATSQTFIGRIYTMLGLRDIADAADKTGFGYPQLSAEYIVQADPDLIVLADSRCCGATPASVAARPGWGGIAAVRNGHVVAVDDDVASRWGPRIVEFLRAVAAEAAAARR